MIYILPIGQFVYLKKLLSNKLEQDKIVLPLDSIKKTFTFNKKSFFLIKSFFICQIKNRIFLKYILRYIYQVYYTCLLTEKFSGV